MRRHLHTIALILFVLVFLFDLVLWGAVPGLPDVGTSIERSAHAEAVLASLYLALGVPSMLRLAHSTAWAPAS